LLRNSDRSTKTMNKHYVHGIIKRREEFGDYSEIPTGAQEHEQVFRSCYIKKA